jgi:hypothetical protein
MLSNEVKNTWEEVKNGTKFIIVSNNNEHNYPMNVDLIVNNPLVGTRAGRRHSMGWVTGDSRYNNLEVRDCRFYNSVTIEGLYDRLKAIHIIYMTEATEIKRKLELCIKYNLDEYKEDVINKLIKAENKVKKGTI